MLEITIMRGGIRTRKVGGKAYTTYRWPTKKWYFPDNITTYTPPTNLPSCEDFYKGLKAEGCTNRDIIYKMTRLYIPWFQFNGGRLRDVSKCVGLIGHRGSNKTSSAVYMLIFDYLIRFKPVFSNTEIACKVRYRDCEVEFRSQPWSGADMLDIESDVRGGAVFCDEINLAAAQSSRFMSTANLDFTNDLQQIRKRQLNVLWTAQSWSTVDPRVRWQSDFIIECQDCYFDHSYQARCPGDKAKWTVYELSGLSGAFDLAFELSHRNLMDYKVGETKMYWLSPISWPAYDTFQEQDADYIAKYKLKQATTQAEQKKLLFSARHQPDQDIVDQLVASDIPKIDTDTFWKVADAVNDKAKQTRLGILMQPYFDKKRASDGNYYYDRRQKGNESG